MDEKHEDQSIKHAIICKLHEHRPTGRFIGADEAIGAPRELVFLLRGLEQQLAPITDPLRPYAETYTTSVASKHAYLEFFRSPSCRSLSARAFASFSYSTTGI